MTRQELDEMFMDKIYGEDGTIHPIGMQEWIIAMIEFSRARNPDDPLEQEDEGRIAYLLLRYRHLHYDFYCMEQLLCVNITNSAALIAEVVPYLHSQEKVSLFLAQIISDEAAEKEWRDKLVLDLFARFLRERHTVEPKAARHIWHRYDCAFDVIGDEAMIRKVLGMIDDPELLVHMVYCRRKLAKYEAEARKGEV